MRRVLFSETEQGEVCTEQFRYDKHLPASARKQQRPDGNGKDGRNEGGEKLSGRDFRRQIPQRQQQQKQPQPRFNDTPPREDGKNVSTSATAASSVSASPSTTSENTILRPSKFYERNHADSSEKKKEKTHKPSPNVAVGTTAPTKVTLPGIAESKNAEQLAEEEEMRKQQYIERYGLLPTITPLSKRYGRMKRQQQQGQQATNGPSDSAKTAATTANTSNNNPKRKRRGDLLGAASRLGRNRRARIGNRSGTHSSLPTVLLGNKRTPTKRRRDEELSRTDEWVWRAMNHDEKENRRNDYLEGSVAKRGKFGNNNNDVVGTPPKNSMASLPPVMTPPKTPGPSNFAAGSATPAPKKSSGLQPSIPSFSLVGADNDDVGQKTTASGTEGVKDGTAPGFSFGGSTLAGTKDDAAAAAAGGTSGTPGFSFGTTATAGTEKNDAAARAAATTAPGFSFGASTATATTAAPPPVAAFNNATSTPAAQFSFGASSSQPAQPAATAQPTQPASSFGAAPAGGMPAPAATPAAAPTTAQFSFGASSQPTPAVQSSFGASSQPTFAAPAAAAAAPTTAQFSSGASSQPAPAAQSSFGASSQPTFAAQSNQPASSSGAAFAFGTTAAAGGMPAAPVAAAGAAAPPSAFSFGAGASSGIAAPPPPAFGAAAGVAAPPSSFSFGAGASSGIAAPPPPAFGVTPASTTFGPGGPSGGGGASARRRAKASGGRRR